LHELICDTPAVVPAKIEKILVAPVPKSKMKDFVDHQRPSQQDMLDKIFRELTHAA